MVSIVGTTGTGFLQNDPVWRDLERMAPGDLGSPWYLQLRVADRAGVLAALARKLAVEGVSVARLVQQPASDAAVLHIVTHEAPAGRVEAALEAIRELPVSRGKPDGDSRRLAARRRGARLGMTLPAAPESSRSAAMTRPLIERFRDRLPVSGATPVVSLGEGSTPLLAAPRLAEAAGVRELWLKWEASNPTGSYKDRGMTVAVSKALEDGAEAVICASTGNTAASAAAYATRAGLPAVVLTPQGAVSGAKLAQTRMLGATVLEVRGDFDEALAAAQELGRRGTHALVNSLNPNRRAGQKTAVFEIVEELGGPPDAFALPYGGGGNTSSYAQALAELGLATPLVSVEAVDRKATLATAIRIGDPVHASAVRTSGARVVAATDEELVDAWRLLASSEGLFCEPSSAAGLVAVLRGDVEGDRVVVTITGHGLKDPAAADRFAPAPIVVEPDPDAIAGAARAEKRRDAP